MEQNYESGGIVGVVLGLWVFGCFGGIGSGRAAAARWQAGGYEQVINFLRYTHFNNSTDYWGPRAEYRGKPVPPNGHVSLWMEEAQMPENVLKAFQTAEGDKLAK